MCGQLKTRERIARIWFARLAPEQERREREQAVAILFACGPRDGAARSRRDIDEVIGRSGGGAAREIETEAELIEEPDLPAHEQRRPILEAVVRHRVEQHVGAFERRHVRLTLGQHGGGDGGERVQSRKRRAILEHVARPRPRELGDIDAEILGKPRAPGELHAVAGLELGAALAR